VSQTSLDTFYVRCYLSIDYMYVHCYVQVEWKEEKNDSTRPAIKTIDRNAGAAIEEFKVLLIPVLFT
jgi:hypothetical protein